MRRLSLVLLLTFFLPVLAEGREPEPKPLFGDDLKVYAYMPSRKEGWRDGTVTASGGTPGKGGVAVSRDLFKKGWTFGRRIKIGNEVLVIDDLMHPRHKRSLDRRVFNRKEMREWGVRSVPAVLLPESPDPAPAKAFGASSKKGKKSTSLASSR